MTQLISDLLKKNRNLFGRVLSLNYGLSPYVLLDLSSDNPELAQVDLSNPIEFDRYIKKVMSRSNSVFAIGKYNEDRCIYAHSKLFSGTNERTIHLAIDLWVPSGVEVLAPFDGKIHSFANNKAVGDYGPTIILEHNLGGIKFYTLYGHLSSSSLNGLKVGKSFSKGEVIGFIGNSSENGGWPTHLHFQVIENMLGKKGDFPGVASREEREKYVSMCPDPNLILKIEGI